MPEPGAERSGSLCSEGRAVNRVLAEARWFAPGGQVLAAVHQRLRLGNRARGS